MKFSRMIIVAALASLPLIATAGQQLCSADDVHCITFSGATGKYIKATGTVGGVTDSFTQCFDNTSSFSLPQKAVESGFLHVGDVFKADFRQCKTANCNESIPVGVDQFTIEKKAQGGYTSTPSTYTVKFDETYGESCTPDFRNTSMTRDYTK